MSKRRSKLPRRFSAGTQRTNRRHHAGINPSWFLFAAILLLAPQIVFAATIRSHATWGWDTNIREAMEESNRIDGQFFRLHLDASTKPIDLGFLRARPRLRAFTDRYAPYTSESRHHAEGRIDLVRPVGRSSTIWMSGRIEGRTYPENTERDFDRGAATIGFGAPLKTARMNVSTKLSGIDYNSTSFHDRESRSLVIDYKRPITSRLDASFLAEFEWSYYGRKAIKPSEPDGHIATGKQRDRAREGRLGFRYLRGWLYELTVSWRSNLSNSFGYSLGRRSIEGAISGWLPGSVLLQIRGRLESVPYYDKNLDEVYIEREGEEIEAAEDNNRLHIRLRRSVTEEFALEARASWFKNESLLVGDFYQKAVSSIGIVWTPGTPSDF